MSVKYSFCSGSLPEKAIKKVEEKYNCHYIGDFDNVGWEAIFYSPNPDKEKGHSHFLSVRIVYDPLTGNQSALLANGEWVFAREWTYVEAGGIVYVSCGVHNYRNTPVGDIDGGSDYCRFIGNNIVNYPHGMRKLDGHMLGLAVMKKQNYNGIIEVDETAQEELERYKKEKGITYMHVSVDPEKTEGLTDEKLAKETLAMLKAGDEEMRFRRTITRCELEAIYNGINEVMEMAKEVPYTVEHFTNPDTPEAKLGAFASKVRQKLEFAQLYVNQAHSRSDIVDMEKNKGDN